MLSLHLKATMMKVSDPIMFGHAVKVYFASAFAAHALDLELIGANPNNGLGDVLDKVRSKCSPSLCAEILASFEACHSSRPGLAMVDSSKGITNLEPRAPLMELCYQRSCHRPTMILACCLCSAARRARLDA